MSDKTEAESVAEIVSQANQPTFRTGIIGSDIVIWPDKKIESLERFADRPLRKRAFVRLTDTVSFSHYVREHAQFGTALFGDQNKPSVLAVIDYHEPRNDLTVASDQPASPLDNVPNWGEHRAELVLAQTIEWKRWISNSGAQLTQVQFAEMLEDNLPDIIDPVGASLLEIAQTLQAKNDVGFRSAVRLSNGQHQLTYVENLQATAGVDGNLEVPERIKLALAPFEGAPKYEVVARLRYRITAGKLSFSYQLERPHKIVEAAFKDVRAAIESATGKVVVLGQLQSIGA